ncbi:helix-turn-helix domain-containing protein [Albidovulum sediminis]|uniref:helix-turn-helix domain-containing protein n=1 Tax=Albidovulum sediminis TaxID=3066345 RepID=UPI0034E1EF81
MSEAQGSLFDLGPECPRRGRGRPRFEKNKENQWLVDAMLRHGMTQDQIAERLGVSVPTLRRYFFSSPHWNPKGLGPGPRDRKGEEE